MANTGNNNVGEIIVKNSRRFMNEGEEKAKGILYCGRKYTNDKGCACGKCNGYCGPESGCPCPDCYYTLSYILYSTGKMKCPNCNKTLLRINLFNLKNIIFKKEGIKNASFSCDICESNFSDEVYIPLFHCLKCDYDMCPKCSFSKISFFKKSVPKLMAGNGRGLGLIFCAKNYTHNGFCLCGGCDGNCGPNNGCPCPLCESILAYNLYLNFLNKNHCKCKNIFVKTTIYQLKLVYKSNKTFQCSICSNNKYCDDFASIYHCYKCKQNICQACAYKKAGCNVNKLALPKPPIFLGNLEKTIRENKKFENCSICKQKHFKIVKNKDEGENITIYLKTLIGRIYTININDAEDVEKLKVELGKFDNKYKVNNTILIYKKKILNNDDYINELEIENESLIDVMLKPTF